jgi:uncharacterized protein (DUF58 family)
MLEARAFEPDFLRRLDRLVLGVRRARMQRSGERRLGRMRGTSIELKDYKAYAEGDDLRMLDWNALARLDDLLIRNTREERQIEVSVLVDASASMAVPQEDDKFGLAMALAAALAYVAMTCHDAARLAAFSARRGGVQLMSSTAQSRRELYPDFLSFVRSINCRGRVQLHDGVAKFMLDRHPRGVLILVSDFLVPTSDYQRALEGLLAGGHEVKVVHVMGDSEVSGSYSGGFYRVRDSESGEVREVTLNGQTLEAYRRRVASLAEALHQYCNRRAIAYVAAFGARNLDSIITGEFPKLGLIH